MATIEHALKASGETLGLVLLQDIKGSDGPENLHQVGVVAKVLKAIPADENSVHVIVNCLQRMTIVEVNKPQNLRTSRNGLKDLNAPSVTNSF